MWSCLAGVDTRFHFLDILAMDLDLLDILAMVLDLLMMDGQTVDSNSQKMWHQVDNDRMYCVVLKSVFIINSED